MLERDFIKVARSGDEGVIWINKSQITSFCENADEQGLIEGSCVIYIMGGPAYAVNHTVPELVAIIQATEVVQ